MAIWAVSVQATVADLLDERFSRILAVFAIEIDQFHGFADPLDGDFRHLAICPPQQFFLHHLRFGAIDTHLRRCGEEFADLAAPLGFCLIKRWSGGGRCSRHWSCRG